MQIGTTTTNIYFDTGLANSTTYRYKISAYGPGGETFNASTTDITTYGAPTTRNVTCSGNISTTLQTQINASADGDIVSIGAGTCTVLGIGIDDKAITLTGAGQGVTNITSNGKFGGMTSTGGNTPTFRLTNLTINSDGSDTPLILVQATGAPASWRGGFRIDHVTINQPTGGSCVYIFGPVWGLIDHNNFTHNFESCILTEILLDSEDGTIGALRGSFGQTLPYNPGGGDNT